MVDLAVSAARCMLSGTVMRWQGFVFLQVSYKDYIMRNMTDSLYIPVVFMPFHTSLACF